MRADRPPDHCSRCPTDHRSGPPPWRPGNASLQRILRMDPVLVVGTIGVCLAVAGQLGYLWFFPAAHASYLAGTFVLLAWLGYCGFSAAAAPQPARVQHCVKTLVMSIVLLDTCTAWAARGPMVALAVAIMVLPAVFLGRRFQVT